MYFLVFFLLPIFIYGQERPDWIDELPFKSQTVYFRGRGHGSTLEAAKQKAVNNAFRKHIVDRISLPGPDGLRQASFEGSIVLDIEIKENSLVSTLNFFDEEIHLQDEYYVVMETGNYEYFVLFSMPREGINRLIYKEVMQHFTPFSRWERFYESSGEINIDYAIYFGAFRILENLPENRSIVIVPEGTSVMEEFATEELITYISRSKKISVFDRSSLNEIEIERMFQFSGEIDDDSIISIGHFTGADTVIAVRVTGAANNWRIRFKAIDTRTAQLLYQTFYDFKL
jgi:TolB-like protein